MQFIGLICASASKRGFCHDVAGNLVFDIACPSWLLLLAGAACRLCEFVLPEIPFMFVKLPKHR